MNHFTDTLKGNVPTTLVSLAAILLAALARLASCGTSIIIQKDWVVVVAGGDTELLATINSILRTIGHQLTLLSTPPSPFVS